MKKKFLFIMMTIFLSLFLGFNRFVLAHDINPIITSVTAFDKNGDTNATTIDQFEQYHIKVTFDLANGNVQPGEKLTIQLNNILEFVSSAPFQVVDKQNNIIAEAKVDPSSKTIVLTFTEQVTKHPNANGDVSFYIRLDTKVITEPSEIPVEISINGDLYVPTLLNYRGPSVQNTNAIQKSGWQTSDPNSIQFGIAVNRLQQPFQTLVVNDRILLNNVQIDYSRLKIYLGDWMFSNGKWTLENSWDATHQFKLVKTSDQAGFEIQFNNSLKTKGALIRYPLILSSSLLDKTQISSQISLSSNLTEYNFSGLSNYSYTKSSGSLD